MPEVKCSDQLQDTALRTILRESGIYDSWDSWTEEKPLSLGHSDSSDPDAMWHLPAFQTSHPEHGAADWTQTNAGIASWNWPNYSSGEASQLAYAGTSAPATDGKAVAQPHIKSSGVRQVHRTMNELVAAPNHSLTSHSNVWTEQG